MKNSNIANEIDPCIEKILSIFTYDSYVDGLFIILDMEDKDYWYSKIYHLMDFILKIEFIVLDASECSKSIFILLKYQITCFNI